MEITIMLKSLATATMAVGLMFSTVQAAEPYQAGKDYVELTQPVKTADPNKVEVVEMFGYPCPHCNSFEPMLKAWEKQKGEEIDFERIPVVFGRSWEGPARSYYTAELMGKVDETHQAMFDAIHVERKRFRGAEDFADFYESLGVDRGQFLKTYNSFAVNMKLNQGDSKLRSYQVDGVPTLIVNGKYRVTAGMAGSQADMLKVVDYLINKEEGDQ
jgi:thiol:disulfide interchange protein DsbA